LIDDHLVISRRRRERLAVLATRNVVRRDNRVVLAGLINLHRFAVEIRIGEMVGRTRKSISVK